MEDFESEQLRKLDVFRSRYYHAQETFESVKALLAKADQRFREEPANARKWRKVLDNLEMSLDESRKRLELASMELSRLEREIPNAAIGSEVDGEQEIGLPLVERCASAWELSVERTQAMTLEEASLLQEKMDSGEIHDRQLAASLELANQLGHDEEEDDDVGEPGERKQLALRTAMEKIKQQQFNAMTLADIKLVMACHSLLTSRLEPTSKDQRMKRILNGAIKILRRRRTELEALEALRQLPP